MKRKLIALTAAFLLLLTLTGCGAKSEMSAANGTAPPMDAMEAPMAPSMDYNYGGDVYYDKTASAAETGGTVTSGQKLIRTASLELETTEFEATTAALEDLVGKMGGYMENSSVHNGRSGYRFANYTVRVPAERYEEFLNQAGGLCHETWRSASQEDISEVYYDTQGRLKTQQIKLERLQELLTRAETMEDIITIESAISETEQQIDDLSGTLRHYDGKVDYATVGISLSEVYKYSNTEEAPMTFAGRMGNSFASGWKAFVNTLEDLAVALAYSWMWLAILAVAAFFGFRAARKKLRSRRGISAEKNGDNQPKN